MNPMENNAIGLKSGINKAAKASVLNELYRRCIIPDAKNRVAIMTALTTDGDKPVMAAYAHRITMVMRMPYFRSPIMFRGHRAIVIIKLITPTCSPLSANT